MSEKEEILQEKLSLLSFNNPLCLQLLPMRPLFRYYSFFFIIAMGHFFLIFIFYHFLEERDSLDPLVLKDINPKPSLLLKLKLKSLT